MVTKKYSIQKKTEWKEQVIYETNNKEQLGRFKPCFSDNIKYKYSKQSN